MPQNQQRTNINVSVVYPAGKIDDTIPDEIEKQAAEVGEDYREAKRCLAVRTLD